MVKYQEIKKEKELKLYDANNIYNIYLYNIFINYEKK